MVFLLDRSTPHRAASARGATSHWSPNFTMNTTQGHRAMEARAAATVRDAQTNKSARVLTPRSIRSNLAAFMAKNEEDLGRRSTHLSPARTRGHAIGSMHPKDVVDVDYKGASKPIGVSATHYSEHLAAEARKKTGYVDPRSGGLSPRSAIKARADRAAAGLKRWEAQQKLYYGHARNEVEPPPLHRPQGRPTNWLDYLVEPMLGNKAARESSRAPDWRTSSLPGNGRSRRADGSFSAIRHMERGHSGLERFNRGVPPGYGGFIPQHYGDATVSKSSNNTIGWVEPEPEQPVTRQDAQTGSQNMGAQRAGSAGSRMGPYGPYLSTPRSARASGTPRGVAVRV